MSAVATSVGSAGAGGSHATGAPAAPVRREGPAAWQGWVALAALIAALAWPLVVSGGHAKYFLAAGGSAALAVVIIALAVVAGLLAFRSAVGNVILFCGAAVATANVINLLPTVAGLASAQKLTGVQALAATSGFWALVVVAWLLSWLLVRRLCEARASTRAGRFLLNLGIPFVFGVWIVLLWEVAVRGFSIPFVILPPPSMVWARLIASIPTLAADFRQTFLKAVIAGYAIGCSSGFLAAIAADRVPFLKRGLLPVGNLVSALPLVAIAPIMVMWFGFDWQSKAAVVVAMTFFPMLINTLAGLAASDAIERDLMHTYAAGYWQSLFKLRLPAALPFIFNALKINSTLAMIGAIVAEFFGTPIVGMGFRISTEVGRMNTDMVWAEIAVAALAGSVFYGVVALIERGATFWHPSFRQP
jgi:NitT/TauT family transport system permease protein